MRAGWAALGIASGLLVSRTAAALKISIDPAAAIPIGQTQTFRGTVSDASGPVTFHWDFGDNASADSSIPEASHRYTDASHYTVIVTAQDPDTSTTAAFVQTVHHPLTSTPPHNSTSILVDASRHHIWNVNPDSATVSLIDSMTLQRVREVPVGQEPHSLAQSPDGTIWVTNQMSDEVVVLEPTMGALQTRIPLPYASQPLAIAFGPGGKAYVSLFATGQLVEIDSNSRHVEREISLGPTPAGVSVGADGRIFVTRFISPDDHGEVWVVSPDSFAVTKTIALAFDQGPDSSVSGRGVPDFVSSIAISPDGTQGWVSAKKDDIARGPQRDGLSMNSDNFVRSVICVVDLRTDTEDVTKRQDIDNRSMPVSVAFSPIGDYAYISLLFNNEISMADAFTTQNVGAIKETGHAPDGLALAPDGRLLVNAFLSREVIAYDMSSSLASIDQGAPPPLARIRTIDQEPLSAEVLMGKQIFFNAADPRMSNVGYMTCGTCHFAGLSDGRVWDFTDRGEGLRNTKSLLGVRGAQGEGRLHWSANMDEVQDFERDIRDSQGGFGFMSEAEYDARKTGPSGTYETLGKPAAGASKELDALAAYVQSLARVPRSPFRNPDGSFTKDARAGRKIFERAGCPDCHSGPDFTDSSAGMLHDVGTILPTSGKRLGGPLTGIDTPTLKGVWQTAPYLHDGRAATLPDIFVKYTKDQMGKTSDLTSTELGQLVRYLQELDDVPETPVPDEQATIASGGSSCSMVSSAYTARRSNLWGWFMACAGIAALRRRRFGT
jgi:DNA-binding beta-propeller fold protein YncE